jgi:hypothetical protein
MLHIAVATVVCAVFLAYETTGASAPIGNRGALLELRRTADYFGRVRIQPTRALMSASETWTLGGMGT